MSENKAFRAVQSEYLVNVMNTTLVNVGVFVSPVPVAENKAIAVSKLCVNVFLQNRYRAENAFKLGFAVVPIIVSIIARGRRLGNRDA